MMSTESIDSASSIQILPQHTARSYNNQRNEPHLPSHGTKTWQLLQHGLDKFRPRHSHATCVFKCPNFINSNINDNGSSNPSDPQPPKCLWLTGGYSEAHRTFDLQIENENSDVWYSPDGSTWTQVTNLQGDFLQGIGNWDAKVGGYVAPWYSRYGHSLNALDADGDGMEDVMVLAGGNSPIPSNDVWITSDGIAWYFDGYAPWTKRAYHGATVFMGKLWIVGGTPLSNDVWMGSLVEDSSRGVGYRMDWSVKVLPHEAPWAPRAGHCAVSQLKRNDYTNPPNPNATEPSYTEYMYIIGGFAGFQKDHPRHSDGARTRNDVWITSDGITWDRVLPPPGKKTMPWIGRAFHGCVTWHSPMDRSRWVASDSMLHLDDGEDWRKNGNDTHPRIFITGGGYMGRKGNNEVRSLETYMDTWWSSDGSEWTRVNYEEGWRHKSNLYSTNEWTEATIEESKVYLGKWGHTLEAFFIAEDLDKDSKISNATVSLSICSDSEAPMSRICKKMTALENRIPALFVIGGKLENGPLSSDVFVSKPGVHCEINGETCGGNGDCGPATLGCICQSMNFSGNFCLKELFIEEISSASFQYNMLGSGTIIASINVMLWIVWSMFGM
ncbi:hypothetical protein ACHAXS_013911 [Conticribra weissflogii]